MKLRSKKTGKIIKLSIHSIAGKNYESLAEINEDWEDYEEPKWLRDYWFIDSCGRVIKQDDDILGSARRETGNYFETKEEAKKAVEKLKAWKRLKDKGFKFYGWNKGSLLKSKPNNIEFACDDTRIWAWEDIQDDLDLLFGGEE